MKVGLAQSRISALQRLFSCVRLLLYAAICDDSLGMGERAMTKHGLRCRVPIPGAPDEITQYEISGVKSMAKLTAASGQVQGILS